MKPIRNMVGISEDVAKMISVSGLLAIGPAYLVIKWFLAAYRHYAWTLIDLYWGSGYPCF